MKRIVFLVVLALAACQPRNEPPATQPAGSPQPTTLSFELTGVVIEASGSASTATSETTVTRTVQSPTSTPVTQTATPATRTPSPTTTSTTRTTEQRRTVVLERGAPGSIAVRVLEFNADTPCLFNQNDTMVFAFTPLTVFEPVSVTEARDFPNNLQGMTVHATGVLRGDPEECIFGAERVEVQSGTVSPTGAGGRATPRSTASPSPSPTRGTPSPTTKSSPASSPT